MGSPAAGALRLAHAATFGTVAFALALIAHVAAGGPSPQPVTLIFLAGAVAAGSVLVTGRRRGVAATTTALGAVQIALHAAFMALAPADGCMTLTMPASHAGPMSMTSCLERSPGWMGSPGSEAPLLARGDRALWLLATLLLPVLRLRCAPLPPWRPALVFRCPVPVLGRGRMVCSGVGRRGPPHMRIGLA